MRRSPIADDDSGLRFAGKVRAGFVSHLRREVFKALKPTRSMIVLSSICRKTRQVSHESIYRTLFIQARGALNKELLQHLRRSRGMRRSRHHTQKSADRRFEVERFPGSFVQPSCDRVEPVVLRRSVESAAQKQSFVATAMTAGPAMRWRRT